jgi:diguanylate cyclase (GGDEF)-like protein
LTDSTPAGPIRVVLLSADYSAARLIEQLLETAETGTRLVTHPDWDSAAAEALLDHPGCCVLLDTPVAQQTDLLALLERVRTAAPAAPIVVLTDGEDDERALAAVRAGAQDCLVKSELRPALLRRSLAYAVERKRAEAVLSHQALHDPLTGLPNRALFLDRLGVALDRARRSGAQLAVLFLDFDNFKQINDSRGHPTGDRLLATLAGRLSTLLRPMDTVARFGGDEFTFLFENLGSEREVVLIADRICHAVARPITLDGVELAVTVSIGIAMVDDPTVAPDAAIREADAAMYRAKERGRARFELWGEDSRRRGVERLELEGALRQALERDELRVHYRPSASLHGRDEVAFQALACWQHPRRGLIGPAEFMPMAESSALALPIARLVLGHAVQQLARWRDHDPPVTVSLSLSHRLLADVNLAAHLNDALHAAGLEANFIRLDVLERAVTDDPDGAAQALSRLKAIGVRLAIAGFGSGGLPVSLLRTLPVDAVKIDASLLDEVRIVAALVDLGHALGLDVIADGAEPPMTEEELEARLMAKVA